MISGLRLAVLYGIYPHRLGFCGPQDDLAKRTLRNFLLKPKEYENETEKILKGFEAAYAYYKLIARANAIKDPFDERVVRAYWVGNNLLEKVSPKALAKMILTDFIKPGLLKKSLALKKAEKVEIGAMPHHSFHVFIIGSITGRITLNEKLMDLCRVGWGKIINDVNLQMASGRFKNEKLIVEYQPIVKNKKFFRGKSIKKEISCNRELLPKIKKGDWISFHWNNAIETLSRENLQNLKKYTAQTLNLLNG